CRAHSGALDGKKEECPLFAFVENSPAKSAPIPKGCKAMITSAGPAKRSVRSLASMRSKTAAKHSATSGRLFRIGGTSASMWAFIFWKPDFYSGAADG